MLINIFDEVLNIVADILNSTVLPLANQRNLLFLLSNMLAGPSHNKNSPDFCAKTLIFSNEVVSNYIFEKLHNYDSLDILNEAMVCVRNMVFKAPVAIQGSIVSKYDLINLMLDLCDVEKVVSMALDVLIIVLA